MKKVLVVMLSLLMVLSFAGCTKKEEPVEKATVTIWHTYTKAQKEYLEKAIADFNASQDVYTVVAESQARDGFADKIYNAVINGNGPDMYFDYASTAAQPVTVPIVATIRHGCRCDSADNLTLVLIEGAGELQNVSMRVEKE